MVTLAPCDTDRLDAYRNHKETAQGMEAEPTPLPLAPIWPKPAFGDHATVLLGDAMTTLNDVPWKIGEAYGSSEISENDNSRVSSQDLGPWNLSLIDGNRSHWPPSPFFLELGAPFTIASSAESVSNYLIFGRTESPDGLPPS
jgi:hypothetical protein